MKEELVELEGHFMLAIYACLTFYFWVINVIVTGIFVGKMISDLEYSRKLGKQMQDLKYRNDLKVIELEIIKKQQYIADKEF